MDPILPSVYHRLTDPEMNTGPIHDTIDQAIDRVMNDLEDLLRTKRPKAGTFAGWPLVETSVVNFGVPDVSHGILESADVRGEYCQIIKAIIEEYDPRLRDVVVSVPSDEASTKYRKELNFHIQAELNLYPHRIEKVDFHSKFDLSNGSYSISRTGAA